MVFSLHHIHFRLKAKYLVCHAGICGLYPLNAEDSSRKNCYYSRQGTADGFELKGSRMKKLNLIALGMILCLAWEPGVFAQEKPSESPVLVGRITFIEGQLLRYVYAEKDWVATVKDAPFGLDDALYSNDIGKAEFKLPNGAWVRAGSDTQIQLIALREDVAEVDVASGTARFYDKSPQAVIKATTPFGYVVGRPGTAFDLYVGDESAEVISLDGTVDFIVGEGDSRYTVVAGGASIISDGKRAIEGDGTVDAGWDEWNLKRERLWAQRIQVKGDSVTYLPPSLTNDAYALDRHGRWERIYYQGGYRTFWRPTSVSVGWQPFTTGRWTVWNDDNTWIPDEEFGYVTHHYGNWIYANSHWYWAPPVRVGIGYWGDSACWYPGRVSWIYSGISVGWIPLAPAEIYYSHHYWGPASVIVGGVGMAAVSINLGSLAYVNHAVIVNQGNFYGVNNYYNVRIANVNRTSVIRNYRAAPVVNSEVIRNYSTNRNRFVYNMNYADISAKPHQGVLQRIDHNRAIARQQASSLSAGSVHQGAAQIRQATPLRAGQGVPQIEKPRLTGKIVPENQVNRPGSELQFRQHQLKSRESLPKTLGSKGPRLHGDAVSPGGKGAKKGLSSGGKVHQKNRIAGQPNLRSKTSAGPAGIHTKSRVGSSGKYQAEKYRKNRGVTEKRRFQQDHRLQRNEMHRQERLQRQQNKIRNQRSFMGGQGAQRSDKLRMQQRHPVPKHFQGGAAGRAPGGSMGHGTQHHP